MAKLPTPDRATASQMNPFVSPDSAGESLEQIGEALESLELMLAQQTGDTADQVAPAYFLVRALARAVRWEQAQGEALRERVRDALARRDAP